MARRRYVYAALLLLLLTLFVPLGFLIFHEPKVVIRPLLPRERAGDSIGGQDWTLGHPRYVTENMLGHIFPLEGACRSNWSAGHVRHILLRIDRTLPLSEVWEALSIMEKDAEQNACRTEILFTFE